MQRQRFPQVLMLLLFLLFTICCSLVLYYQIQRYDTQRRTLEQDQSMYIAQAYLRNQMKEKQVSVMRDDVRSWILIEEMEYDTYIYVFDGWLMEQRLIKDGEFDPADGEKITEMVNLIIQEHPTYLELYLQGTGLSSSDDIIQVWIQRSN